MSRKAPKIAICPNCDGEVAFRKNPYIGQTVVCMDCEADLEVIGTSPLEVDFVMEDDFDYDDDGYDDDDEYYDDDDDDEYYDDDDD